MLLGQSVYAGCQGGILVVLARLGGPEVVGRYALALAITAPVMGFSSLMMRQMQAADATDRYRFDDYFVVRLATTAAALLAISAIAFLGGYARETALVILAVGIVKSMEALSDIFYGLEQRRERFDLVAQSFMLRGTLGLSGLAIGLYLTDTLLGGVAGLGLSWCLVWLLFDRSVTRRWRREQRIGSGARDVEARIPLQLGLAWAGLPLGVAAMLYMLNTNVPRYVIEEQLGEEALGIFAAMAYLALLGDMVVNSVTQAANPRLARYFMTSDTAAFRLLLGRLLVGGVSLGGAAVLVAAAVGQQLLALLFGYEFAQSPGTFVAVMLAGTALYATIPLNYGLIAVRLFKVQPLILVVAVGVNLVTCLLLVPYYGLMGAAWGWTIALFSQLLVSGWLMQRRLCAAQMGAGPGK